jgi:hypothetical protein
VHSMGIAAGAVAALALVAVPAAPGGHGAHADGAVIGRFLREGGPIGPGGHQPPDKPLSGTIRFTAAGRHAVTIRVGSSGKFSVHLAAGLYKVAGSSPSIGGPGHPGKFRPCSVPLTVRVRPHRLVRISVVCPVP